MNSDVQDRKIRQIVEALDGLHDHKQALKLCNAAIKQVTGKTKGSLSDCQWFILLKADAMARLGKEDEAVGALQQLTEMELINDRMIRRAMQVCSSVNRLDLATEMVEKAKEGNKESVHLAETLFLCYAMERRFKEQQAYAMRLMKEHPGEPRFFFYVAVSMALQAPPGAKGHILLTLAERWMDKARTENRLKTLEELLFFTQICERQGNVEKALELVQTNQKLMKKVEDCLALQADYMRDLGRREEQKQLILTLLREHDADNWGYLLALFEALLPLKDGVEPSAAIVAELEETVASIQAAAGRATRTGLMAGLELASRQMLLHTVAAKKEAARAALLDGLVSYFSVFGHKSVCYADMDYFIRHLDAETKELLVSRLEETLPEMVTSEAPIQDHSGNKAEVDYVYRFACIARIRAMAGMDVDEKRALEVYQWGLSIPSASQLEDTDRQFGDELLLLVAHAHVSRYLADRNDPTHLVGAQQLLQYGLAKSSCNFHFKLLQMRCHIMAGSFTPALRLLESLDVKNIQMDSITHVVMDGALQLRPETEATQLFSNMLAFYTKARGETPRLVCMPYQQGSYSKLGEFYEFLDMMHHSLQAAVLKVERGFFLLSLVSKCTVDSFKEVLHAYRDGMALEDDELSNLHDTRDQSASDGYHSLAELSTGLRFTAADVGVANAKRMLRVRSAIFHFLSVAIADSSSERLAELLAIVEKELKAESIPEENPAAVCAKLETACWRGILRTLTLARDVQQQVEAIQAGDESKLRDCCEALASTRSALEDTWMEVAVSLEREGLLRTELLPAAVCFVTQLLSWTTVLSLRWVEVSPKKAPKSASSSLRTAQTSLKNAARVLPAALIELAESVQSTLSGWQQGLLSGSLRLESAVGNVPWVLSGDEARLEAAVHAGAVTAAQTEGVSSTLAGLTRVTGAVASCKKR